MKLHITEKAVKEAIVPAGQKHILIFDTEQPGFAVQKTSIGNMSYIVMYRNEFRKQRQEKLGKVAEISTPAARALARARLADLNARRKDSRGGLRLLAPTMDDFFFKTFLPKVKLQSRSYSTHTSMYRNHIGAAFGPRRLNEIDGDEIVDFADMLRKKIVRVGQRPHCSNKRLSDGTVKRILILVRHIFNEAMRDKRSNVTMNRPAFRLHLLQLADGTLQGRSAGIATA